MSTQDSYETIEAYLNGTLTGDALVAFEQALQSDHKLANQVRLIQNVDTTLKDKPVLDFQKIVQEQGESFMQKNAGGTAKVRQIGGRSRQTWAIAAALLALVVSAVVFWNIQSASPVSGEALFAQHFEPYTLNQSIRGGDDVASVFQSGVEQYQAGRFSEATETFRGLVASNEKDMVLAFCLANAYLNQDPPQLDVADAEFQKIIADGASIYVPRAKWYKALILLKKEQVEEAKVLLQEVAQSPDNFGKQASALLEEL